MNRRTKIMQSMSGGTEAPKNARRQQIMKALSGKTPLPPKRFPSFATGGMRRASAGEVSRGSVAGADTRGSMAEARKAFASRSASPSPKDRASPPLGEAYSPALGQQLSRRVESGNLSRGQAMQTMQQRQTLKKAFGSDWRKQVFGQGGAEGLKASGPFGQGAVRAKRNQALQRAKRKLY